MKYSMRVAILYLGRRGAGGKITFELAQELAQRHVVQAFLSIDSEHLNLWRGSSLKYTLFRTYGNVVQALFSLIFPFIQIHLSRKIRQFRPDVLLFPMFHPWNDRIQKTLKKIPSVVFIHDPRPHPDTAGRFYFQLEKESIKHAARCVVLSRNLVPILVERGISVNRIDVIPLGVFEYSNNTSNKVSTGVPTILFFGRIVPYKGLDILLQAFEQVHKDKPCQLLIVGEGNLNPYKSTIRFLADVIVINRWIDESEIVDLFLQCDLVVLPYKSASQSGVIPIAASCALPVVATNTGGLSEQIEDGISGWLVPPGDVGALASAMSEVLVQPEVAKQRGAALQERFKEHFSWEKMAFLVEKCLEKAQQTQDKE